MRLAILLIAVCCYADPINVVQKGVDNSGAHDVGPAVCQILADGGSQPTVLYFSAGTYYCASSEPNTNNEECIKVWASVHFAGDGVCKTIYKGDANSTAMAILGFFNPGQIYSYEDDPGFAAAPAAVGTEGICRAFCQDSA
jgi:hypothetical protein